MGLCPFFNQKAVYGIYDLFSLKGVIVKAAMFHSKKSYMTTKVINMYKNAFISAFVRYFPVFFISIFQNNSVKEHIACGLVRMGTL